MKKFSFAAIVDAVNKLCQEAAAHLPPDVVAALEKAMLA